MSRNSILPETLNIAVRNDNELMPVIPMKSPMEAANEMWGPRGFEYYFQCIVCDSDKTLEDYYTKEEWERMKREGKYPGIK